MNPTFQRLMNEAAQLTRGGQLKDATAAIQAALAGMGSAVGPLAHADKAEPANDGKAWVIEGAVREVSADDATPEAQTAQADLGGRFLSGAYACAAGRRDYKLYIPPGAGQRPLPLVVMLHGCTQDPDDFAAGTAMNELAQSADVFVLYPAQSAQANPQRCWNWFKHNHQARGRGEPALLAGMTREVMAQHQIDETRVFVAGLSAGGAMAAILGHAYPDLFAAVGVHSGLAAGAASDLPSALAAMQRGGSGQSSGQGHQVPTIVFHGDADTTVHARNGEQVVAACAGTDTTVEQHRHRRARGRHHTRHVHRASDGRVLAEHWVVHGAAHAWSGGRPKGSYTDGQGPDASAEMLRFFMEHPRRP